MRPATKNIYKDNYLSNASSVLLSESFAQIHSSKPAYKIIIFVPEYSSSNVKYRIFDTLSAAARWVNKVYYNDHNGIWLAANDLPENLRNNILSSMRKCLNGKRSSFCDGFAALKVPDYSKQLNEKDCEGFLAA